MNEVFDIKRLGTLMRYEIVNYIPRYFKSLLIFASIIVALWMFSLTVDISVASTGRVGLIAALFSVATALSPYIVYKDMNNRKKGYIYAMIPASTLEKLLSMMVMCLICVPVMTYTLLTATDVVLHLFSKIGMGSFSSIHFYNPFLDNTFNVFDRNLSENVFSVFDSILYLFSIITYTMMFNTIFRKNKVLKTILFNISVSFAITMLVTTVVGVTSSEFWESLVEKYVPYFEGMSADEAMHAVMVFCRTLGCLAIILYLAITYFRIKKVNY